MTKPAQASLAEQGKQTEYSCLRQNVLVWNTILPGDAQDPTETTQVEGIKSALLTGLQGPCFAAIEKCTEHARLKDLHLGVDDQHGVVPGTSGQTSHRRCCLADP